MTRVLQQDLRVEQAQAEFFLHGAGKKNETFLQYCNRTNAPLYGTPEPTHEADRAERTLRSVRTRLGRLYRTPITA